MIQEENKYIHQRRQTGRALVEFICTRMERYERRKLEQSRHEKNESQSIRGSSERKRFPKECTRENKSLRSDRKSRMNEATKRSRGRGGRKEVVMKSKGKGKGKKKKKSRGKSREEKGKAKGERGGERKKEKRNE